MKRPLLRSLEGVSLKKYMKRMYLPEEQTRRTEAEPSPKIEASKYHDMLEPQEPPTRDISGKRKPALVREIIQEPEKYGAREGSTRVSKISNPFSTYVALMCDLIDQDLVEAMT